MPIRGNPPSSEGPHVLCPLDDEVYAGLQKSAREHLWMHFTRHVELRPRGRAGHRAGRGCLHLRRQGQAGTSTRWPACSSASSATAAPSSPRPPRSRPASWRSSRCGPTPTPTRSSSPSGSRTTRPGDLNRVFFTSGGGEAVETAWKLAKNYFKLTGKPMKHKVISRAIAYHGTTQGALSITGLPPLKQQFEPLVPSTFRVPNTNFYRAPEQFQAAARRPGGVRPLGRRPDRGGDRERGPRHRRRGVPRAGAERRRLLPAAARLLPAGPRDLRRVRRAAGLRRGDLRVRPARAHVRRRALRLPARHDHLRQGHHLRLRPAGRDDRHRPAHGAVPARAPSRSRTATPSAATRSRPRWRWPTSTSSRRRAQPARAGQPGRVPRDPGEAPRPADRRRRARRRATSTASSWSRTRRPRRPSTTTSPRGCCAGSCPRRCTRPGSTAAPTTAATRSSSSSPPLICDQQHFDEIEQMLRGVLEKAWSLL